MSHVIIIDMRESNNQIVAIREDDMNLAQFDSEEEAQAMMDEHSMNVFPYEIIDMG